MTDELVSYWGLSDNTAVRLMTWLTLATDCSGLVYGAFSLAAI